MFEVLFELGQALQYQCNDCENEAGILLSKHVVN
jgi:hypothetical protein